MKKALFLFIINSLFISSTVVAYAGEKVYKSDIAVLMDDMPVESVVINDEVYIDIEDLKNFVFEVSDEGDSYRFIPDASENYFQFLPAEEINVLKNSIVIEEIGEAELSDIIGIDDKNDKYALYEFNGDYFIKLRALEGKYGSLKWDARNRRAYFNITEGMLDACFASKLGISISEDERLGLANKNSDIEYLSFRGQVENYIPNGIGIVEANYTNGDAVILKGNFPEGVAEGRFISYKTNENEVIVKSYFGVNESMLNGSYLYIDYNENTRFEGNYELGTPVGKQRKGIINNEYLFGYEIIDDEFCGLKLYDKPFEKLISFCEIDENEQK